MARVSPTLVAAEQPDGGESEMYRQMLTCVGNGYMGNRGTFVGCRAGPAQQPGIGCHVPLWVPVIHSMYYSLFDPFPGADCFFQSDWLVFGPTFPPDSPGLVEIHCGL